ncbi:MAG: DUF1499 domain-containing protein [Rhodobacteraceae bacterium]|jgi:uncharacterized protein (DUF1499 family)|nr:DUF1499 domain-containing protein [Paracoccaceae bacterium]
MTWRFVVLAALVLVAAGMAWVRLAPSDPARWHVDPATGTSGPGSHAARVTLPLPPEAALAALDAIAMAEPRTIRLAGSPAEGRITWVSRSRVFGFPDYTTAAAVPRGDGSELVVFGRLRFGQSDLGVNAARVGRWLAALAGT